MTSHKAKARDTAEAAAVTLLRLTVGVIFVVHGSAKLTDVVGTADTFAQMGIPWPHVSVYLAIVGEFAGGLGLVVGFLTRIAALGGLCTMAAAIAFVHVGNGLLAMNGGWEYPMTLLLVTLFFVVHGAGPVSIDAMVHSLRSPQRGTRAKREGHGTEVPEQGGQAGAEGRPSHA